MGAAVMFTYALGMGVLFWILAVFAVGLPKSGRWMEVVKSVVQEFVGKRENDQIGMVVFGSEAFTQCPLTLDHGILATFLGQVEIGMAGEATAIGNLIAQMLAIGDIDSLAEGREIIRTSFAHEAAIYEPQDPADWERALIQWRSICRAG